MSKRRIVIIGVLLGVVVIGGVGAIGLWTYHEQPQFCATCHIMEPYLESWQASDYGAAAHAEADVTCLECHEPTTQQQVDELVMYVQGDFSVPLDEGDYGNEFCFDCHEANEHTSDEEVIQLTAGLELNPHDSHLIGEMECGTCHKMHKASEDYCAECHGPLATGTGWTTGMALPADVAVWTPDMDCRVCHVMDPYFDALEDPTRLAYVHGQVGLGCLDCHQVEEVEQVHEEAVAGRPIEERTVEMQFCLGCHVANRHTSYEEIIERTEEYIIDGQNINPHDPHVGVEGMSEQYECSLCHKMIKESPPVEGCYICHHERTFGSQ